MIREYETTFIVDSLLQEDQINATIEKTKSFIEKKGGKIKNIDRWGKRRLAYEIAKKQYVVKKGQVLEVERLPGQDKEVSFDKVLLLVDKKNVSIGTPYVAKAKVKATIQGEKKDKKVIVYKFKRRKKYRKKQGHRQIHTILKISNIYASKINFFI